MTVEKGFADPISLCRNRDKQNRRLVGESRDGDVKTGNVTCACPRSEIFYGVFDGVVVFPGFIKGGRKAGDGDVLTQRWKRIVEERFLNGVTQGHVQNLLRQASSIGPSDIHRLPAVPSEGAAIGAKGIT